MGLGAPSENKSVNIWFCATTQRKIEFQLLAQIGAITYASNRRTAGTQSHPARILDESDRRAPCWVLHLFFGIIVLRPIRNRTDQFSVIVVPGIASNLVIHTQQTPSWYTLFAAITNDDSRRIKAKVVKIVGEAKTRMNPRNANSSSKKTAKVKALACDSLITLSRICPGHQNAGKRTARSTVF